MKFHLVGGRFDPGILEDELQLGDGHVGGAYVPHKAALNQLLHASPGLHVIGVDVGLGIFAPGRDVTTRWMEVGKRPMDKVQIEIVELEISQGFLAGSNHILFAMLVVPKLGGDPQFFSLDAGLHYFNEGLSDLSFISVDGRTVEMPIAESRRGDHRFGNFTGGIMVGPERAQSDARHGSAGIEDSPWYERNQRFTGARCLHVRPPGP